jgi:ubiquinone/menaquinone biosynthesis C-methylase UbiE
MNGDRSGGEQAAVGHYFDTKALEYVQQREGQLSFQAQKRIVLEMVDGAGGRALDIGCGPAMMEPALLERGFEVWGIDASAEMIEYGKKRMATHPMRGRCHLSLGDAERLAWPDGYFDAVISMGVLEYLPAYDRMIAEIRRVLRPGGIAALTLPTRVSAYRLTREAFETARTAVRRVLRRPPRTDRLPLRPCIPWQLDAQLERAGLRKIEGRFCNFVFYPLHELNPAASNALNRRLEGFSSSALGAALGTQYIVKVRKNG